MSLFEVFPPRTVNLGDAWAARLEVDFVDWTVASDAERDEFVRAQKARLVDSLGNSVHDVMVVMGGQVLVRTVELHSPPRRSGPEGTDRPRPEYRHGRG